MSEIAQVTASYLVLSVNSNVDDPVLAAEYGLVDHVLCDQRGQD